MYHVHPPFQKSAYGPAHTLVGRALHMMQMFPTSEKLLYETMALPKTTHPAKHRRKGMAVCLCSQISGKTTNIGGSNELLADFKLYKDQK